MSSSGKLSGKMEKGCRPGDNNGYIRFFPLLQSRSIFTPNKTTPSINKVEPQDPRGICCSNPPGLDRDYRRCVNNTQRRLPNSASQNDENSLCETPGGERDFWKLETKEVWLLKCSQAFLFYASTHMQKKKITHMRSCAHTSLETLF